MQTLHTETTDTEKHAPPTYASGTAAKRDAHWRRCEQDRVPFLYVEDRPRDRAMLTLDMLPSERFVTPEQHVAVHRLFDEVGLGSGQRGKPRLTCGPPVRYDVKGFDRAAAAKLARRIRDEILTQPSQPDWWTDEQKRRADAMRCDYLASLDGDR